MELKNTKVLIFKKGKTFSIHIWVEELKSWLIFDNFKTRKLAKEFLADESEMQEVRMFIEKRIADEKKEKAKKVLLQFPDGLKPYASAVVSVLKEKIEKNIEIFVWLGSCFGACDLPLEAQRAGVDLIVQFGHSSWKFQDKKIKIIR